MLGGKKNNLLRKQDTISFLYSFRPITSMAYFKKHSCSNLQELTGNGTINCTVEVRETILTYLLPHNNL